MNKNELAKGIYWVGAIDWDIRDFHGYSTYKGSTYNAFLVIDEKITLFDTVKRSHMDQLLYNIRQYVDPSQIDYVVVNHVELDHSGSMPELMALIQPEKVFCSPMGEKALQAHFHNFDWPLEVVKSDTEISLGARTVQFIETRMLHWPDSMFSYLKEDGILFSSDAFGQHVATSERFDDEVDMCAIMEQAEKYYANILNLFSPLIQKLLVSLADLNLDIKMIAPDHGIIWRSHQDKIIEAYGRWSRQEAEDRVLLIVDSMWHSTEKMAQAIAEGIESEGIPYEMLNLHAHHRSDIMTKALTAKGLVFGSSTLNNGILPRMAGQLSYMKGLKPTGKIGATFGSFGWSGEAVSIMNNALDEMKITRIDDGLKLKYVPDEENLACCREYGKKIAEAIKAVE